MTDHEADLISIAASYLPEGYVIVPVEPTTKMLVIGRFEIEGAVSLIEMNNAYRAMIKAAQESE